MCRPDRLHRKEWRGGGGGGGGVKRQLQIVTWESVVPLSGTSNGSGRPVHMPICCMNDVTVIHWLQ